MADGRKVLLIDDDPDFVAANTIALKAKGFSVLSADSGEAGARLAEAERPDVIVADLMMEELYAGFALVEQLVHQTATARIPVVMVSAVTTEIGFRVDPARHTPDSLHVAAFLHKPIEPVALAEKITEILDQSERE